MYADCILACDNCASNCEQSASACLEQADVTALAACIRSQRDCADVCRLASLLLARGSRHSAEACRLAEMIAIACAAECERHPIDPCRAAAEACQRAADECRKLAAVSTI